MPNVIEETYLTNCDFDRNANKFIVFTLFDDGTVTSRWGRVGVSEQTKSWSFGPDAKRQYDRKILDKLKPKTNRDSYTKVDILTPKQSQVSPTSCLADVASREIDVDSETTRDLIRWLSEVNVHQIVNSTSMTYNEVEGVFRTPLGVVGKPMVDRARILLNEISPYVEFNKLDDPQVKKLATEYLRLIPQDLGGTQTKISLAFIFTKDKLRQQADILDALDASIASVLTTPENGSSVNTEAARTFDVKLHTVNDDRQIDEVTKLFNHTRQSQHLSYSFKLKKLYSVDLPAMRRVWENDGAKLDNRMRLWHGTKPSNVLSILKQGLIIPPSTASFVNGRAYGNGVYFSDQSTKSLNYACGYWGGGDQGDRIFMFLADVGMGRYYVPSSSVKQIPVGYDSCFAKAGKSGIANNEMIVFRLGQCNLVYLVEFSR